MRTLCKKNAVALRSLKKTMQKKCGRLKNRCEKNAIKENKRKEKKRKENKIYKNLFFLKTEKFFFKNLF